MDTRLAQVIAQSTGPDGRIDRARLYDALRLSPEDPVALIVEVALSVEEGQGSHAERLAGIMDQAATRIGETVAGQTLAYSKAQEAFSERAGKLDTAGHAVADAAERISTAAAALGNRALLMVFFLGAFVGILVGAITTYLIIHR